MLKTEIKTIGDHSPFSGQRRRYISESGVQVVSPPKAMSRSASVMYTSQSSLDLSPKLEEVT